MLLALAFSEEFLGLAEESGHFPLQDVPHDPMINLGVTVNQEVAEGHNSFVFSNSSAGGRIHLN